MAVANPDKLKLKFTKFKLQRSESLAKFGYHIKPNSGQNSFVKSIY
ncbi:hypothetical protein [Campylobacter concisus]|nr:hypothetical protein [Campylobacter concisus]